MHESWVQGSIFLIQKLENIPGKFGQKGLKKSGSYNSEVFLVYPTESISQYFF